VSDPIDNLISQESLPKRTTDILKKVDDYNFVGNIIPHAWYGCITMPSGRCDLLGCCLLAEILYWYRLTPVYSEDATKVVGYKKKFKDDLYQRSNQSFADKFGSSKRAVADALKRLEDLRLITREFCTIETERGLMPNVQFVAPIMDNIKGLDPKKIITKAKKKKTSKSSRGVDTKGQRDRYNEISLYPPQKNGIPITKFWGTYTKSTTKIPTKSSKQHALTLSWGMGYSQPEFIDVAAAYSSEIKNETENNNTDCQAQSPIAEQPSVAEKNIENAEQGSSEIVTTPQKVNLGVAAEQANGENRQNDEAQNNAKVQHGEVTQETKPQPSHSHRPEKPMVQKAKNAKASNVVEPVIGKSLTDGQIAALGRLAEIINTAKPELGVTTQDLARTILNPRAFRECRDQFLKKCNTIKKMALAGRWSPSEAQKPSANRNHWSPDSVGARHSVTAAVSDSTNPALMNMRHRESVDGRVSAIQNSIASIKSTFSDRMSKHRGRQFFVGQMNAIEEKKSMLLELGVDPAEVERLCDVSDLVRNLPQMQENITQFPVMSESTQMHRQAVGVGK